MCFSVYLFTPIEYLFLSLDRPSSVVETMKTFRSERQAPRSGCYEDRQSEVQPAIIFNPMKYNGHFINLFILSRKLLTIMGNGMRKKISKRIDEYNSMNGCTTKHFPRIDVK